MSDADRLITGRIGTPSPSSIHAEPAVDGVGSDGPDRRRYTITPDLDPDDTVGAEWWDIHGGGHAVAGGDNAGSYTDPAGPNASAEMVRCFLQHARAAEPAAASS